MSREIGSLHYTLGIKGASNFTKTLEDARRVVSKMPQSFNSPMFGKMYDPMDLTRFGSHLNRVFSSSAMNFEQKFTKKVSKQINELQDMLSQMTPGSKAHSGVSKMLDTLKAGGGRVSLEQVEAMAKGKVVYEEQLRRATNERSSTERTLRSSQSTGVIQKGSAYSNYLEAGLANQIINERDQNKLSMLSMKSNAEISKHLDAYDASRKSAADLLELEKQIYSVLEDESRVVAKMASDKERTKNEALSRSHAYVESRGKKFSYESVMAGNRAFSEAKSDRATRIRGAATAKIDEEIESISNELRDNHPDKTTQAARDLKLRLDGLLRIREVYEEMAGEIDDFIESQNLAPRALPGSMNFEAGKVSAVEDMLTEGADLSGTTKQEQAAKFFESKQQKEIDRIVSNTKSGRFTTMKTDAEEEIKSAEELLQKNQSGVIKLTNDQEVALKNHITQWTRLGQLSQKVLDVLSDIAKEEEHLSVAMKAGDQSGISQHRDNLKGLNRDLGESISAINAYNRDTHNASEFSGRWGNQMQELGYGVQDFVQVLAGGGGLGPALRSASNNFSQFFAVAGGPKAAIASTAVALGVLGISLAMDSLGKSTESASKRIDDLIERLRVVGELNAEYAKSPGTVFGAALGKDVSLFGNDVDLTKSIDTELATLGKVLQKEMAGKGGVRGTFTTLLDQMFGGELVSSMKTGRNVSIDTSQEAEDVRQTMSENFSATYRRAINAASRATEFVFGQEGSLSAGNELTGSTASQGVFDRIIKQRFVQNKSINDVLMPDQLMASLNKKESELAKQLLEAQDIEAAMKAAADASLNMPEEMKKIVNQLFRVREKLKEMEDVQKKAVDAYGARVNSMLGDENRMSIFSGEYSKGRRSGYAEEFIGAAHDYTKSTSKGMRESASKKADIAFKAFKSNAPGGGFEGPAAAISNFMSSAFSGELSQIASLEAIIKSDKTTDEMKKKAQEAIDIKRSAMAPEAISGIRNITSGYSPTMRIGETEDAFIARVQSEVNLAKQAIESFGVALKMPRNEIDALKNSIDVMGIAAKHTAENLKRIKEQETARGSMAGKFSKRGDEEYANKINDIINREKEAITAANQEYDKGPDTKENYDRWMAKKREASVQASRELEDAEREYEKAKFQSKMGLSGDVAGIVGGRDAKRLQEEMANVERRRRIQEDKNLTDSEKEAEFTKAADIHRESMDMIDRKNVSFTDVGSQWKTIQNSLQADPSKKMAEYMKQYLEMARGEGLNVKLKIGA